ncbi:MAG: exo-alpha-sialidase [Flavobacteriaceae bacterium]|nr:exo-alpha-sialidase [Flavobacteriaceae bacterium]
MNYKLIIGFLISVTLLSTACSKKIPSDKVSFKEHQFTLPILKGKEHNKVFSFTVKVDSTTFFKKLTLNLKDTNISIIKNISVFYGKKSFEKATLLTKVTPTSSKVVVEMPEKVSAKNTFWITATLNKKASLSDKIAINLASITTDKNEIINIQDKKTTYKQIGVAVKQRNEGGVHTFRIPGLATTNKGTLIGVYDIRYNSSVDLQANVDIGMSRSTDGGETWEPMKVIIDMGTYGDKPQDENGVGDPAVLVDRATNTIWVIALWKHGGKDKRAWWDSKEGLTPEETGQLLLVKSEDDGKSWSKPINITKGLKNPSWKLFFNGPGKGITMKDGTLVFAAQYKDKKAVPYSTLIYSKDHGKSWKVGTGIKSETTEAQIVELDNGTLMINARDDRNRANRKDTLNGRTIMTTTDLGKTWTKHATSRSTLIEPNCMASLISHHSKKYGDMLFFSNPNSKTNRNHITIKASLDKGNSWKKEHQIELYEEDTFGYSCMTIIDDKYIGILYEGNRELYFQKIPIEVFFEKK